MLLLFSSTGLCSNVSSEGVLCKFSLWRDLLCRQAPVSFFSSCVFWVIAYIISRLPSNDICSVGAVPISIEHNSVKQHTIYLSYVLGTCGVYIVVYVCLYII